MKYITNCLFVMIGVNVEDLGWTHSIWISRPWRPRRPWRGASCSSFSWPPSLSTGILVVFVLVLLPSLSYWTELPPPFVFSILSFRSIYPMKILTLVLCWSIAALQNFRKPTKKWQNTTFTLNVLSGCARYQWIASAPRLWLRLQIGISYGINLWSAPFKVLDKNLKNINAQI